MNTAYREPLAIHAAQGLGPVGGMCGLQALCQREPFASALAAHGLSADTLPRGAVVAYCRLAATAALTMDTRGRCYWRDEQLQMWREVAQPEAAFGDYTEGRFGFRLEQIHALPAPVPAKGALSLWNWVPPPGAR